MNPIALLCMIISSAALNRARGSKFYDLTDSTEAGRVLSMGGIAFLTSMLMIGNLYNMTIIFLIVFSGLMTWCSFAWDSFWSAQIGDAVHSKAWGNYHMFLRQLLILPTYFLLAFATHHLENIYFAATAFVMWLPYYLFGIFAKERSIELSELTNGGIIGLTLYLLVV